MEEKVEKKQKLQEMVQKNYKMEEESTVEEEQAEDVTPEETKWERILTFILFAIQMALVNVVGHKLKECPYMHFFFYYTTLLKYSARTKKYNSRVGRLLHMKVGNYGFGNPIRSLMMYFSCAWATAVNINYLYKEYTSLASLFSWLFLIFGLLFSVKQQYCIVFETEGRFPGNIDMSNLLEKFKLDDRIFCKHCKNERPKGAVHCQTCRSCYTNVLNHCPYIGVCITTANFKGAVKLIAGFMITGLSVFCSALFFMFNPCALDVWKRIAMMADGLLLFVGCLFALVKLNRAMHSEAPAYAMDENDPFTKHENS